MKSDRAIRPTAEGNTPPDFMRQGQERLSALRAELDELRDTLLDIEALSPSGSDRQIERLVAELDNFEPAVTMIGQIKSGKTTLVNAMIGRPGLLPADVNPWTSVVTSLHLNVPLAPDAPVATFQFFDENEWDHLVTNGGRIGELSMRAGADDEVRKLQEQVAQMREKTRARLGRRFELLLGQRHEYRHIDEELIQRYVCLGDDFADEEVDDKQGRFADITRAADLYVSAPAIPIPLCIRDTPGVNDTFLMREQITIRALRDSRLCVVVLSASQALSSVDMGLVRLVSNVKSDGVVIFVNRIDELSDPASQIPEIRESILKTMARMNGPKDPHIIFGSAYWANAALADSVGSIVADSAEALRKCADALVGEGAGERASRGMMWRLSGIPELFQVLGDRIARSAGARVLNHVRQRAANHVSGLRASTSLATMRIEGDSVQVMSPAEVSRLLEGIEAEARAHLKEELDRVFASFAARVNQSHARFLERALEALLQHLEKNGEDAPWQYSPDGLRLLLRTSYQVLRKNLYAACGSVYETAAQAVTEAYAQVVSVGVQGFSVRPPLPPELPAPVSLGTTIALDLHTSWWKSWWKRRRGYRAYAKGFYSLIEAETAPIVAELRDRQAAEIRAAAEARLEEFLAEQRSVLMDVAEKGQVGMSELQDLFGVKSQLERAEVLEMILEELSEAIAQTEESATDEDVVLARKGAAA